ncbi:MAG: PAS domain S-box protein [Myxococcota bacterium]
MLSESTEPDDSEPFERDEAGTTTDPNRVSGRFLTDLFRVLDGQDLPSRELLGDLPIPLGEHGEVLGTVEWDPFAEFLRRLSRAVGGPSELARVAAQLGPMKPARALGSLAGLAASPWTLYRAAAGWALRRAIPAVETEVTRAADGQIEIHAWIVEGQRPCPELFHFAAGASRTLPRVIGLGDAVVVADVREREAFYRIAVPPSPTLFARVGRVLRTIFSAGDVLRFLEAQQLELHAKNEQLRRANAALAASEERYRALVDTAVDVLCEIDRDGRVVYVSASVESLIGYAPEQVTGSHYRLWTPRTWHDRIDEVVEAFFELPAGRATQEIVRLHSASGDAVFAELTARTYDTFEGERRVVCIFRDVTERGAGEDACRAEACATTPVAPGLSDATASVTPTNLAVAPASVTPTDLAVAPASAAPTDLAEVIERALGDTPALDVVLDEGEALPPLDEEKADD